MTEETKLVYVDGKEALAFIHILPGSQEGTVALEAGVRGLPKDYAARVLRHVATMWENEAKAEEVSLGLATRTDNDPECTNPSCDLTVPENGPFGPYCSTYCRDQQEGRK